MTATVTVAMAVIGAAVVAGGAMRMVRDGVSIVVVVGAAGGAVVRVRSTAWRDRRTLHALMAGMVEVAMMVGSGARGCLMVVWKEVLLWMTVGRMQSLQIRIVC